MILFHEPKIVWEKSGTSLQGSNPETYTPDYIVVCLPTSQSPQLQVTNSSGKQY